MLQGNIWGNTKVIYRSLLGGTVPLEIDRESCG